ncbi:MAG: HAMP domain-containing histidine kinase [Phycisphaeraceae bacterium]|nr:HAMP domain-containing histidine kinase [Phycisphaeraceae bacterium]
MLGRLSLANKCLLLFGAAVVLIVAAALAVAWFRMNNAVDDGETEVSRQMVRVWEESLRKTALETPQADGAPRPAGLRPGQRLSLDDGQIVVVTPESLAEARQRSEFIGAAWEALSQSPDVAEFSEASWEFTSRQYRFARAVRSAERPGALEGLVVLERSSPAAARAMLVNSAYLLSAGLLSLGLAVLVFYLITNYIVLSPVRSLTATAEAVRGGDLDTRSDIRTGDEFEDLAEAFNAMLGNLQAGQNQLRAVNASLDDRLEDLAQRNIALYEANKLKGDFLASVTHELRTPLNSILGFAELLEEIAQKDATDPAAATDPQRIQKRQRYLDNILTSGRSLLELVKGILEMAKVEAGRMELTIGPLHLKDACESLVAMMRPAADKRSVELRLEVVGDPPVIQTDAGKFRQIVFNLLSNAVKFTGDAAEAHAAAGADGAAPDGSTRPAIVTLRVETLASRGDPTQDRVRVSVLDTGPGIREEDMSRIFEKFVQLDSGHARRHAGTGLGLAICKELTALLQGEILVDSELGRGSMFSVILPLRLDPSVSAQTKMELSFRSSLAGQKS